VVSAVASRGRIEPIEDLHRQSVQQMGNAGCVVSGVQRYQDFRRAFLSPAGSDERAAGAAARSSASLCQWPLARCTA
jgi:phage gp45-like